MIKISIITATYNSAKTFEQTVSSISEQDYPNIEYIVVDGGSTDETLNIIKKYSSTVTKWISEPDKGLYDALNKGVKIATGDYIQIIGSDDALVDRNIITKVVREITPNVDILSADEMAVIEENNKTYPITNIKARNKKEFKGGMVAHAGMFVRKELLLKYPFDIKYKISSDYKFFLQCYYDENVKIKYISNKVVFFSKSGMSSNEKMTAEEDNLIYKELNLPFHSPIDAYGGGVKKCLKKVLAYLHMYDWIRSIWKKIKYFINVMFLFEEHHCTNKICRWCGRM